MDYIIECKNVTYSYPLAEIPAIRDLNVSIERGKFYGVIGENGSEKRQRITAGSYLPKSDMYSRIPSPR